MATDKQAIRMAERAARMGRPCPTFDDLDLNQIAHAAYTQQTMTRATNIRPTSTDILGGLDADILGLTDGVIEAASELACSIVAPE